MDEEPKVVEKVEKPIKKEAPKRKEKSPEPPKVVQKEEPRAKPKPKKGKISHISQNFYHSPLFRHAHLFFLQNGWNQTIMKIWFYWIFIIMEIWWT